MTLTRWKLMAGFLGLSIVGVVAVANPQCPNTKKDAAREAAPPGRVVAAKAEVVPALPDVAAPKPLPVSDLAPPLPGAALPFVTKAEAPPPAPQTPPPALELSLPPVAPTTALPKVEVTAPPPAPPVGLPQVVELPLPGVVAAKPTAPVPDLPVPVETKPAPLPTVEPKLAAVPGIPATPAVEPAPVKKVEATPVKRTNTSEEAAVRVMIHLGTGQPKFDVLAGDDVLLKAVCDNVDIRSPAEKGAGVTPLKAGGKVRFSAPGCEGTCDNLTVLPSTGEVELAGNVRVHCRMGKGETEINAATMKFKLGSAPAYAVPEPGVTPASVR